MNAPSLGNQPRALPSGPGARAWVRGFARRMLLRLRTLRRAATQHDPTVEQMVDRIMASACGESCAVRLNPRITRIKNVTWLLPICVQQFGTTIDIQEHPDGDDVVLTITVTDRQRRRRYLHW